MVGHTTCSGGMGQAGRIRLKCSSPLCTLYDFAAVTLGTTPNKKALENVPTFTGKDPAGVDQGEPSGNPTVDPALTTVAQQMSSLNTLLGVNAEWNAPGKSSRKWLGDVLGSLSERVYDKMMRWEFVDMGDLLPKSSHDRPAESDTERLVVLPGFEVSHARKKPVTNIITWIQCFSRYTAAMAKEFPDCTPGFMSHLLTVIKGFQEAEDPGWRLYDEAYREKMASTGNRTWEGMDVTLYQEMCGSRPRRKAQEVVPETRGRSAGTKWPRDQKPRVCYDFNDGIECTFGDKCKFAHLCEVCRAPHPKYRCTRPLRRP